MKRWRSFPLQLFILTVLPLSLLLMTIAFGSLGLHQRSMRTMVGERDERATRAAAKSISEQLNQRAVAVRSLALQTPLVASSENALANASFLLPGFEGGVALFDANGDLLVTSKDPQVWQFPAIRQQLMRIKPVTNATSAAYFSPAFTDPMTGEERMFVAIAAPDGLVAAGIFSPANLARKALTDVFGSNDGATAVVVNTDGEIIYQAGLRAEVAGKIRQHPGVAGALGGNSGTTYLTLGGDEYVVAFSPIPPVGWALVVEEPWQDVADPLLRATELAPLVLVPVVLITLFALWFGVRQIVTPLQALEQKATELGWGNFEAIEEPVGGINEIQRLQAELIHMAHKVKLAQQSLRGYLGAVTTGQEEERRRLARDLHDDTLQSLIALNQRIQIAQLTAGKENNAVQLAEMQQMVGQTIADLRRLTRDLRPIYLEDLGLVPALDMLARDTGRNLQIPITFQTTGTERRLLPIEELALYRMGQEALSNIVRHAHAAHVQLDLHFATDYTTLTIHDDGVGFDVPESPAEMAATGHFGLLGIQERAELIGARITIKSAPQVGTKLIITLPE